MESQPAQRIRTQVKLSEHAARRLQSKASTLESSPTSLIARALDEHLPLKSPPSGREAAIEVVRFRLAPALHRSARSEARRWGCSLGLVVETCLVLSAGREADELDDFRL